MKCRKCGETAVINMRQHKLALCASHFLEWMPEQCQRFIEKYRMFTPEDKILVAVSGGKDSLGLWDILHRLGYQADGLYIGLGIDGRRSPSAEESGYSDQSRQLSEQFAAEHGLRLHRVDVEQTYGATIPELAVISNRGRDKPCAVCGLNKRYIMNRMAYDGGYSVLATGHNLDDEAAVLMQNTLNWAGGYLVRQGPVPPAPPPPPAPRPGAKGQAALPLLRARDGGLCHRARHRVHLRGVPARRRLDDDLLQRNLEPDGRTAPRREAPVLPELLAGQGTGPVRAAGPVP